MGPDGPDTGDGRRNSEDFRQDVLEAARILGYRPEVMARRNRLAMILVAFAVCMTLFAVGVIVF
ncbi:hypothetical protein [Streptomyces sp. NPDC059176]|uniref:hypothetical protein n=1 Tax=unclassified Streptomyces TaxID=2593676 RepID=UPI00367659C6